MSERPEELYRNRSPRGGELRLNSKPDPDGGAEEPLINPKPEDRAIAFNLGTEIKRPDLGTDTQPPPTPLQHLTTKLEIQENFYLRTDTHF